MAAERESTGAADEDLGDAPLEESGSRLPLLASLAVVVALLALALAVGPVRDAVGSAISGDTEALREELRDLGAGGVAIVLALALIHSVIFYPAEILNAAAGFVYGFWPAMALMMGGWIVNGIICHQVGRYAARPGLLRLLGRERFERYEAAVGRGGATLLIGMRLVPIVPFSLFSYVAGSARVPLGTFVWTTAIGYIPITAIFVLLGSRLEELSPTDPVIWGGAAALILLLLVTRTVMRMLGVDDEDED